MADHFLGALKEIERRAQNNILVFSDVLTERLEVIAQNMVGKSISDNDYLKLLELYYKKFSKDENKQAMLFCLLRMQEVVFYKEHKENQNDLIKMEFNEEYDSITKAFLSRKRDYYQITLKNIFQRFILLDTLAYIVFLLVFVLLIHISFRVSFILLVILWALVLFFAKRRVFLIFIIQEFKHFFKMWIQHCCRWINQFSKVEQSTFLFFKFFHKLTC